MASNAIAESSVPLLVTLQFLDSGVRLPSTIPCVRHAISHASAKHSHKAIAYTSTVCPTDMQNTALPDIKKLNLSRSYYVRHQSWTTPPPNWAPAKAPCPLLESHHLTLSLCRCPQKSQKSAWAWKLVKLQAAPRRTMKKHPREERLYTLVTGLVVGFV